MDPIKNTGIDYAMTVPQNQVQGYEDYSSMPMIYESDDTEKRKASSNMLGYTLLGIVAAAGIGYGAMKGRKVSGLQKENEAIRAAKETVDKQLQEANNKIEELTTKKQSKIRKFFSKLNPKNWGKKKEAPAVEPKPEVKVDPKTPETTKPEGK